MNWRIQISFKNDSSYSDSFLKKLQDKFGVINLEDSSEREFHQVDRVTDRNRLGGELF